MIRADNQRMFQFITPASVSETSIFTQIKQHKFDILPHVMQKQCVVCCVVERIFSVSVLFGRGHGWGRPIPHVFVIWGVFCQTLYICFLILEPIPLTLCMHVCVSARSLPFPHCPLHRQKAKNSFRLHLEM